MREVSTREDMPMFSPIPRGWVGKREAVLVSYFRRAFCLPGEDQLRITLDYGLRTTTHLTPTKTLKELQRMTKIHHPDLVIFEVKSHKGIPTWLVKVLKGYAISFETFSKYAYGLEQEPLKDIFCNEQSVGI